MPERGNGSVKTQEVDFHSSALARDLPLHYRPLPPAPAPAPSASSVLDFNWSVVFRSTAARRRRSAIYHRLALRRQRGY